MSDDDNKKVVALVEYRGPALVRPDKANPAIPDHIWERFQDMGEMAAEHLANLLKDERFPFFPIKDQMKIIDTTFQRAYGSPDGSVRRHLHMNADPEDEKGFNALRDMSRRAQRDYPEFRSPHSREAIDAETLPSRRRPSDGGDT